MRPDLILVTRNIFNKAPYFFYLLMFLTVVLNGKAQTTGQNNTTVPLGLGDHRIMTVLIEVGDREFSAEELLNMPALIYGAPTNSPDPPAFSVNDIFHRDSYGQMSIVGIDGQPGGADDIFGPFHIDVYNCINPHLSFQEVLDQNENSLDVGPLAQGVRLLLIVKHNGIWQQGCIMYAGVVDIATLRSDDFTEDEISFSMPVSLRVSKGVIAHEMGHVLGLDHTGLLQCSGGGNYDIPNRSEDGASHTGYIGDENCGKREMSIFGYMGSTYYGINHSNAQAKEICGWLRDDINAIHRIETVQENGTFSLSSISEENEPGLKALKVINGGYIHSDQNQYDHWLYIEYRKTMNADGTFTADQSLMDHNWFGTQYQNSNLFSGALLRNGYDAGGSLLFDAFKTQDDVSMSENPSNFNFNWALPFGETYVDSMTGTRITLGISNLTGTVDVDVQLGRTDFDPPEVIDFYIDEASSTDCEVLIRGEIYDTSGISELTLSLYNDFVFGGDDYMAVGLNAQNGAFSYLVDMYRFSGGKVGLTVKDNAQAQGGNAPNNILDHGVLTNIHGFLGIEEAQLHFPHQDFRCDTVGPISTLLSPLDQATVTNPVVFDFRITDQSIISSANMFVTPLPPPHHNLYTFFVSMEITRNIENTVVKTLPPGTYNVHMNALDIHDNSSSNGSFNSNNTLLGMITVSDKRPFLRGDANQDSTVNIADITHITNVLFSGNGSFLCWDAADANDDGIVDISDAQFISGFLFTGMISNLPAPFPDYGQDPTPDDLNCSGCDCPVITGPMTDIPDPAFERVLWRYGLDPTLDGAVLTASIDTITSLSIRISNISDLTGIQDFTSLRVLRCSNNQLSSLDVSQNTNLEQLDCSNNQLSSLDVSQNIELTELSCHHNQLSSLDVSQNTDLERLGCSYNQLSSLDVSQNIELTGLSCLHNQLNCLNIKNGNNLNLQALYTQLNPNLSCIEVDNAGWSMKNWTSGSGSFFTFGASFSNNCNNACSSN